MITGSTPASITAEMAINAYRQGFFPMADERDSIGFFSFDPRGIIPLDDRFYVRRSLRKIVEKSAFSITFDRAPREVLHACSRLEEPIPSDERWLSEDLIELYMELFQKHIVHTVEVWSDSALVGGLYGLHFGAAFCGESMFSKVPYASQIALVHLVERLRHRGFQLLDAQMPSDHLRQFGMCECSQKEYLKLFQEAESKNVKW